MKNCKNTIWMTCALHCPSSLRSCSPFHSLIYYLSLYFLLRILIYFCPLTFVWLFLSSLYLYLSLINSVLLCLLRTLFTIHFLWKWRRLECEVTIHLNLVSMLNAWVLYTHTFILCACAQGQIYVPFIHIVTRCFLFCIQRLCPSGTLLTWDTANKNLPHFISKQENIKETKLIHRTTGCSRDKLSPVFIYFPLQK
jgi:hypothetical protein